MNYSELRALILEIKPDHIVHTAAFTNIDECEKYEEYANSLAVDVSAVLCEAAPKATYTYISTDQLWNGMKPFVVEKDPPQPLNAYARSKLAGEKASLRHNPNSLILRTNYFGDGPSWRRSFSDWILDNLNNNISINLYSDVFFTPMALQHVCEILINLVSQKASGVIHLGGSERISKYNFGLKIAEYFELSTKHIKPILLSAVNNVAQRPHEMSLASNRLSQYLDRPLPNLQEGFKTLKFQK